MTRPVRRSLTRAGLYREYVTRRRSARRIAADTGWSEPHVRDGLRKFGIALRPAGGGNKAGGVLGAAELRGWIGQGLSVAEAADRSGYSTSGIYALLRRHAITPSPRTPGHRADRVECEQAARLYREQRWSLRQVGAHFGRGPDWARARIEAAGQALRPAGRGGDTSWTQLLPRLVADGLTTAQIAVRVGRSPATVAEALHARGLTAARPPTAPSALDVALLRRLYVDRQHTIAETAAVLRVPQRRVADALAAADLPRRRAGTRTDRLGLASVPAERLSALYVTAGWSVAAIGRELGCSPTRVAHALDRAGIPRRSGPWRPPPFQADQATLRRLYVDQRLDDEQIAQAYAVPADRVRMRRRALGVHRPPSAPPHPHPAGPPPRAVLERLYTRDRLTLEQIARAHHTSSPTVHRWLVEAGITVRPRTSRAHRKALDLDLVRELYETREWTAVAIAAELDTSLYLVLRCLHDDGIPVRPGGGRRGVARLDGAERLLAALYDDGDVTALLRSHRIPRREQVGTVTDRFPEPATLTEALLREAYLDVGLSARHIELLTGQPAGQILDALHAHAIPARHSGASPWLRYQHEQRRPRQVRRSSRRSGATRTQTASV